MSDRAIWIKTLESEEAEADDPTHSNIKKIAIAGILQKSEGLNNLKKTKMSKLRLQNYFGYSRIKAGEHHG